MFWRRLGIFIDALWTDLMLELERNPLAVRQGAAAVACIAAAAIAMPVIAHRAQEQREGAEWTARTLSFENHMQAQQVPGFDGGDGQVRLASYTGPSGLFGEGQKGRMVRASLRGPFDAPPIAALQQRALDVDELDQRQLNCLSEAIYYEARGESVRGQVAVGQVVMNRMHSKHYPKTVCGVVYQGRTRATGCQFTFTCDGSLNRSPNGRAWQRAQHVAAQVMLGHTRSLVGASTHYHTTAVSPRWRPMLIETARLGVHVFYRLPSRSEHAILLQRASARRAAAATPEEDPSIETPEVDEVEPIAPLVEVTAAPSVEASTPVAPTTAAPAPARAEVAA